MLPKTFIVRDPQGNEQEVANLCTFCREHGLTRTAMAKVARGKANHHKQWECRYAGVAREDWLQSLNCGERRPVVLRGEEKLCGRCQNYLPVAQFCQDHSTKHGLSAYCESCRRSKREQDYLKHGERRREAAAAYREAHRETLRQKAHVYYHTRTETILPALRNRRKQNPGLSRAASRRYYNKNAARLRQVSRLWRVNNLDRAKQRNKQYASRPEVRARRRAAYAANPQPALDYQKKWRAANQDKRNDYNATRRARKLASQVEPISRKKVYARDCGTCYLCARPVDFHKMHLDHVVPLSRGGPHIYSNVRVACAKCNLTKNNKLLAEVA